jgi:hypothetical protein
VEAVDFLFRVPIDVKYVVQSLACFVFTLQLKRGSYCMNNAIW